MVAEAEPQQGHVVSSNPGGLAGVLSEAVVHHLLADLRAGHTPDQALTHKVHRLLVGLAVPDAVAADDYEFVVGLELRAGDVRLGGDHLVAGGQRLVLLVLQVAQAAREVQVAVHPAGRRHEAARPVDARRLHLLRGLVVVGERVGRPAGAAQHGAGVAGVGHEEPAA
eukprot:CAMPEP_0194711182 /NCGR_PEP_ID=MMETSP0296-20130528/3560_1 /TAXON_ID=39354 /ORGANISM="Heterosigma akashiwo, Strain CCMP2393" /LENGTH=167 /DNA_ID=CAMNT_0039609143 /DNA_START=370 /DNA_END=870 /DNA_ORIENTATION=+